MAPLIATKRLQKELIALQKEPRPGIIAEPDEKNILKWYYAFRGPTDTPYEGGVYVGRLIFPNEYPMKPPSVLVMTPSGRYQLNTRICLSMSDFHPESWNPMWHISSIIQGVQSFMASDELTTGGLKAPESDRKRLAAASMEYNQKMFPNLFGGNLEAAMEAADKACLEAQKKAAAEAEATTTTTTTRRGRRGRNARASKSSSTDDVDKDTERVANEEDDKVDQTKTNEKGSNGEDAVEEEKLSPEEIERRRKRNAKKRAKQKAKKKAMQESNATEEEEEVGDEANV